MIPVHTVQQAGGFAETDRVTMAVKLAVASLIGGGAGQSVTTAVTFAEPIELPYTIFLSPDQDAVAYYASKTRTGFNLVLNPRLAANTLAVGATDVLIIK